ncbi:unnamed protein product, partial [Closterium sp. Naga37s-1]
MAKASAVSSSMGKGKTAFLALLAFMAVIAASRLQPSHAAVAEATSGEAQMVLVGTQMTISGLSFSRRRLQPSTSGDDQEVGTRMTIGPSFTFNPSRCVAIPPGGTRNLLVWWQQEGKADCTAIQFFPSPTCKGRVLDTLAQGQQRSRPLGAVRSARCIIGATQTPAPSEYPDEESSSTGACSRDRVNPCMGGTCIDRGTQGKSCVCLPNHRSLGRYCDQHWEDISTITVAGSDWRCKDVYTVYGLTLQQFTHMNPGVDCSALLPQGRDLTVQELLPPCSAFYYTQPDDTCASVAQFLDITEESLEQLNPDVSCPSSLPAFRSLCVERDTEKTWPSCKKVIQIGKVVDFQQVAASNGATMVDLCRLNPWISFRDSAVRDVDGICVDAQYATAPPTPPSDTPADSSDTPADSSDTPADSSDTPADSSDNPADSSDTSADSSDTPADSSDTPADSSDNPPSSDNPATPTPATPTTATPTPATPTTDTPTTDTPSDTTAPSEYPDEESSSAGGCGDDRVNPCMGGSCIDNGNGRTCICLPNHPYRDSYCGQDWQAASSITVAGSDWRCKDVYTVYGLTLQQFTTMNPDIDCSALLPQGRDLTVQELLPPCSAFYYTQPADTCSSVAQFLNITEESLQQLNPGVSCRSRLLAFRSLCVERDPAKARPSCGNVIEIGKVEDFQQVAAFNGATMVDLCRLNPWISFRDSLGDTDS